MGGGSADGAAALLALDALYGTHLPQETLLELGVRIGADVPFCLVGGTAMCTGIGEQIQPLPALADCAVVIAQPTEGVSTAAAYAALDGAPLSDRPNHNAMLVALTLRDLPAVGHQLANVFQPALHITAVEAICRRMADFAPLGCRMTGSGSVVYGLFDDDAAARDCAAALAQEYPVVTVCRPCAGPVLEITE